MHEVLAEIGAWRSRYLDGPLFSYLADEQRTPADRLRFAPYLAFFSLSFRDLHLRILEESSAPEDPIERWLVRNSREELRHLSLGRNLGPGDNFLFAELAAWGLDRAVDVRSVLQFLWGEDTRLTRRVFGDIYHLYRSASPVGRVVIVQAMETSSGAFFIAVRPVVEALERQTGVTHPWFGQGHLEAETEHALLLEGGQAWMASLPLDDSGRQEALRLVGDVYRILMAWTDEMLACLERPPERSDLAWLGLPARPVPEGAGG